MGAVLRTFVLDQCRFRGERSLLPRAPFFEQLRAAVHELRDLLAQMLQLGKQLEEILLVNLGPAIAHSFTATRVDSTSEVSASRSRVFASSTICTTISRIDLFSHFTTA
jgi:hypothetical protein